MAKAPVTIYVPYEEEERWPRTERDQIYSLESENSLERWRSRSLISPLGAFPDLLYFGRSSGLV